MTVERLRIGTAGWSIPKISADAFPAQGTSLERYAARFACAEINSTFHRSHRKSTYERWANSVPADFRFSAKLPKTITHRLELSGSADLIDLFLEEVAPLGAKLEILLVQLPPSLSFDIKVAAAFFEALRRRTSLQIVCEPRHPSWFEAGANALLEQWQIARVAADPARVELAALPGGWRGLSYYRLHGSPVLYRSSYDDEMLAHYAASIAGELAHRPVWCIFDNTTSSAAAANAIALQALTNR